MIKQGAISLMKRSLGLLFVMMLLVTTSYGQDDAIPVIDAFGNEVTIEDSSRIITVGGAVAEVLYALGLGDRIVARDDSSIYPEVVTELPSVGYLRFLSAEPVLAVNPSLIIATEDVGPPEAVAQLQQSGVTFLIVPAEDTLDGAVEKIDMIAAALDREEQGAALIADMQADIAEAQELSQQVENTPRVMFVFVRGPAVLTVSGTGTGADEMIRLAGAQNVFDHEGYIPMTSEAVAAAPDVIVTNSTGLESIGGDLENFLELPGVSLTPAAENDRILYQNLDDVYLLGFTPRLGKAILELTYLLHPDIPRPIPAVVQVDLDNNLLLEMLETADLEQPLKQDAEVTLFAPAETLLEALMLEDADAINSLLASHIVDGRYTLDDLRELDGASIEARSGEIITITLDDSGNVILNNMVQIIVSDVMASNGVVHVIDALLVPE